MLTKCVGEKKLKHYFSDEQKTYLNTQKRYVADFNIFAILQTIQKLKACVQVLIDGDD